MNAAEIITAMRDFINDPGEDYDWYEAFEVSPWQLTRHPEHCTPNGWVVPGIDGFVKLTDSHGGEGEGEDWYRVYEVRSAAQSRYFKLPGYWVSHDGATYDDTDIHEVSVKQVIKREWETVQ